MPSWSVAATSHTFDLICLRQLAVAATSAPQSHLKRDSCLIIQIFLLAQFQQIMHLFHVLVKLTVSTYHIIGIRRTDIHRYISFLKTQKPIKRSFVRKKAIPRNIRVKLMNLLFERTKC